jgi:hypothetical protein
MPLWARIDLCLTAAMAGVVGYGNDDRGRQGSRARPSEVPLASMNVERMGGSAALRRHLALPHAHFDEVQYTSAYSAASVVPDWWKSQGRYNVSVLTTGDDWRRVAGALRPPRRLGSERCQGQRRCGPQPSVDEGEESLPPFVLHPDGTFAHLRISAAAGCRLPAAGCRLPTTFS